MITSSATRQATNFHMSIFPLSHSRVHAATNTALTCIHSAHIMPQPPHPFMQDVGVGSRAEDIPAKGGNFVAVILSSSLPPPAKGASGVASAAAPTTSSSAWRWLHRRAGAEISHMRRGRDVFVGTSDAYPASCAFHKL